MPPEWNPWVFLGIPALPDGSHILTNFFIKKAIRDVTVNAVYSSPLLLIWQKKYVILNQLYV